MEVHWMLISLQWRHNEPDGVSNHRRLYCLLNCLFRHRSKKTSNIRVTGLCVGNSPETGEFTAQMASNAENVSIWWRHHGFYLSCRNANFLMAELPAVVMISVLLTTMEISACSVAPRTSATVAPITRSQSSPLLAAPPSPHWWNIWCENWTIWQSQWPRERQAVWNHWQIDCIFISFFTLEAFD